ncbi:MAG: serine/threonine protein kinase [Verrucomicrobia bacterium]|nr:serine/threonine protein kinase [Verrucomicrobiota bacterium]
MFDEQKKLVADETVTEVLPAGDIPPEGPAMHQLVENFHAIIRDRGIYYPVAYRFLREMGRGRQGRVFLGLRQGARGCITRHAIKIFDPSIYPSTEKYWTDMGRIASQTSIMQTLKSPNLVSRDIYDEANGIGYLQMEAIDGIDLRALINGYHLEVVKGRSSKREWSRFTDVIFRLDNGNVSIQPGIALYVMRQVLRGLETLHETGFVHSDIKPGNIMIDPLGYIKIIDFGRAVRPHEHMTFLFGSPVYMAPETHRRRPSLIQSDLYSIGLVGLEMLLGKPLMGMERNSEEDLLNFKLSLPDRLPDLLPAHVLKNAELVEVLRRFVEPDPSKRYASAEDAEVGDESLLTVHKQLAKVGKDAEYGRELQHYVEKILGPKKGDLDTDLLPR